MDLHRPVDSNKTYEEMTAEEKLRYDHQKMHELHRGHESMHTTMVMILIVTLVVAQFVVVEWKRRHYRSYALFFNNKIVQFFTMVSMWSIPLALSFNKGWWRFITIWTIFTLLTGIVIRKSTERPMSNTTPRLVYKWFYLIYKASCFLGIVGYILMMSTFAGINTFFGHKPQQWMDVALVLLFYGLYFGVLGRDVAEYCTDKMAASIGYYTKEGIPTRQLESNVCAVCGNQLLVDVNEEGILENTYKLPCGHVFHEFCIRGWCIVGKKQTCPYCKEKVDLRRMFTNPWDRPHILYGQLLDWIRWLVAWQPLILFLAQGINWIFGLE
ncbi:RING finger protein 121 isoform X1 [Papilio machaon]|uniref:RING finger protein 121 isoform X1 n=1 Tax=Papilio machaon TaxID=76193 RepID=UPI001E663B80|nr:RING finger protein 121 isoform X1 [Papilio machaon]